MTAKQQWMVVLGVVAVLASGAWAGSHFLNDELTSVTVGSDAPGFSALTLDAEPRVKTLSDYRGEVMLLNIWATWCVPCRKEMPSIDSLYREMGPKGLKVVAISIDQPGFEPQIRDFVAEHKLSFEVLHDSSGVLSAIYRTSGVPETFIIGRNGKIYRKWSGADDWNSSGNRTMLTQLLAEPKS
jgi:cytochrome c biogenesis protein CcmG/thiol:disulfide interchange protein DsbE